MTAKRNKILGNLLILLGILFFVLAYGPIVKDEVWYFLKVKRDQQLTLQEGGVEDSPFARFLTSRLISMTPVNTDFSIVIESIGVNAPIKPDVTVSSEEAYNEALKEGVAHAWVSDYPSEESGNVYLFAHSALNFWELGEYGRVFNLVRKLQLEDKIHVFYEGDAYVYEVVNKENYKGWNTHPLTRSSIEPIVTLQTCDPPGTTLNRLVVTAKLTEVIEDY